MLVLCLHIKVNIVVVDHLHNEQRLETQYVCSIL